MDHGIILVHVDNRSVPLHFLPGGGRPGHDYKSSLEDGERDFVSLLPSYHLPPTQNYTGSQTLKVSLTDQQLETHQHVLPDKPISRPLPQHHGRRCIPSPPSGPLCPHPQATTNHNAVQTQRHELPASSCSAFARGGFRCQHLQQSWQSPQRRILLGIKLRWKPEQQRRLQLSKCVRSRRGRYAQ